jgi:hypothetical protein
MISREEFRIRQLILEEYRTGSNAKQARVNINAKVKPVVISKHKTSFWYRRFKDGDICLFNKRSDQYGITVAIQKVSNGKSVRNSEKSNINVLNF